MALHRLEGKKSTDLGGPCPELGSQRKGRDLQRYTREHERLVAGCIPIRWKEGGTLQEVEVLMVTSSSGGHGLVFPKGGWETDETVDGAAARETLEEAGVRGIIEVPLQEACARCRHQWMREALQVWIDRQKSRLLNCATSNGDVTPMPCTVKKIAASS